MGLAVVAARLRVVLCVAARLQLVVLVAIGIWAPAARAQIAVGDSGLPSYSRAIAVPPGIAGMTPKLGLLYAGGGVNGPVGHGWSVQGLSSITRCPATVAVDGRRVGVVYGPNDKLCLDGQRMIQTDAAGVPVAFPQSGDAAGVATGSAREFRTEKDIYARVRAYGFANADASGASGPAYFRVWTKAGQIYEYGAGPSADSNSRALITAAGKTAPMAWAVARISDTVGNGIDFKYEQRDLGWGSGATAGSPAVGHEWNVLEVQYAGNKVIFNYDVDAQGNDVRTDKSEAYHQGNKNVSLRRLKSISTYVNEGANMASLGAGSGTAVKTVQLTYENGAVSGRSRIKQIQECAGGPTGTRCLPATSFSYASGGSEAYAASSGFDADALASTNMMDPTGTSGILLGDFNGDGRTDILFWSDNPTLNKLYTSNGDGHFTLSGTFNVTSDNLLKSDGCYLTIVGDLDGDGLPDLFRYSAPTNLSGSACNFYGPIYVFHNNGDGSFTKQTYAGPTLQRTTSTVVDNCPQYNTLTHKCATEPEGHKGWTAGANFFLLDVDGDGKLDIVTTILPYYATDAVGDACLSTTCTRVFKGVGGGTFSEISTNLANTSIYVPPVAGSGLGSPKNVGEVNGDGLLDFISISTSYFNKLPVFKSRGDGNFDGASSGSNCVNPIDFNGDGRADCLVPVLGTASLNKLYSSDGSGALVSVAGFNLVNSGQELANTNSTTGLASIGIQIADINGDGRADILRWSDTAANNAIYVSNGDGTFTASTTFNLGGSSAVQLQSSDGTTSFVLGDFTGHGNAEILRMRTSGGTVSNHLYAKSESTPPDQLVSVTEGSGAITTLYYVPLSNPTPSNGVSASLGARYKSDLGNSAAAVPNSVDLAPPMYVVATSVSDSGVGATKINTELSYAGLKVDVNGRGMLGFREVMRQTPAPNGSNSVTVDTKYLMVHPYIGVASSTSTYVAALNATSGALQLSNTTNVYCDQTNAGAAGTATSTAPCSVTSKVARPYLYQSSDSGLDLNGASLPQVVTVNTFNGSGDPTNIAITTTGTTAGATRTFTKTTTNIYQPDNTACNDSQTCSWVLGRLTQASVASQVPNLLSQLTLSAGGGTNASATSGSGPLQAALLVPTSHGFGSVAVGAGVNKDFVLANDGANALSITVPSSTSVTGTDFSFVSTTCSSSLAAASSCVLTVRFAPTVASSRSGTLTVATGAGSFSSSLSGTGVAPTLSWTPGWTNWGTVGAGSDSGDWFSVTNTSTVPVLITARTASGPGFWVWEGTTGYCQPGTTVLAPGAACTGFAGMSSLATPGSYSGTATLGFQAQGVTATTFSVQQVYTYAVAATTPSSTTINFGAVTLNSTSGPQTITLTNGASEPFDYLNVAKGGSNAANFSVTNNCGASVPANGSCTLTVAFTPSANGANSASVTVTGSYARRNAGSGPFDFYAFPQTLTSISLSGTGQSSIATLTSAATLTAPAVWYGATAQSVTATYRNDGNVAMTLVSPSLSAPLSVSGNSCSGVAPAASCSIVVNVATNVPGRDQSQIFTPSGATTAPAATTIGWSVYSAVPRWSPTSLSFGSVAVNTTAQQSITLYNDGNTGYNWAAYSSIANAPAGYTFNTGACGFVSASGGSCTVTVSFTPTVAVASYSGSGISMSAASYNTNTFSVSGTGAGSIATLTSGIGLNFGNPIAGTTAPQASWTFRNDGNAGMTLGLGALNSPFALVGNGCSGIAAGGTCSITASMGTGTSGTFSQGSIAVTGASQGTRSDLSLAGTVIPNVAALSTSPSPLAFGTLPKSAYTVAALTVTNSAAVPATGLAYVRTYTGGVAGNGIFLLPGGGTCPAAGGSLGAGASCTLLVEFDAVCTGGTRSGQVTISGSNFTSRVTNLTGTTSSAGSC